MLECLPDPRLMFKMNPVSFGEINQLVAKRFKVREGGASFQVCDVVYIQNFQLKYKE